MTYPLNMTNSVAAGFAVANSEAEHKALSDAGYLPALVAGETADEPTIDSVRAQLDAAGMTYDKRWGLDKLLAALPE